MKLKDLAICTLTALALAACGGGGGTVNTQPTDPAKPTEPSKPTEPTEPVLNPKPSQNIKIDAAIVPAELQAAVEEAKKSQPGNTSPDDTFRTEKNELTIAGKTFDLTKPQDLAQAITGGKPVAQVYDYKKVEKGENTKDGVLLEKFDVIHSGKALIYNQAFSFMTGYLPTAATGSAYDKGAGIDVKDLTAATAEEKDKLGFNHLDIDRIYGYNFNNWAGKTGTATYQGKAFGASPDGKDIADGTMTYRIDFDARKGDGNFTLNGNNYSLESAGFADAKFRGNSNFCIGCTYEMGVYGNDAQEVAGRVKDASKDISPVGLGGTKQ